MATKKLLFYLSSQHNLIVKLLIFFISAAIIVYIMPVEGKFRYSYVKGKAWLHEDYLAPFDFAINKSSDEIKSEQDQLVLESKNYYSFNSSILPLKIRTLAADLDSFTTRLTGLQASNYLPSDTDREKIKQNGIEWLTKIYETGLLTHKVNPPAAGRSSLIIIVKNNIAEEENPENLFTPESALDFICQELYAQSVWKDPELKLFFEKFIEPNVQFNEELTGSALNRSIDNIADSRGMISKGEPVISKGELVTPEKFQMLESIRTEYESRMGSFRINSLWVIAGQFIIVTTLLAMLLLFLILLRKDIFQDSIQLSFLFSLIVAEVLVSSFFLHLSPLSIYLFPFCIMPIIIRAFFDTRLALFAHMLTMLIMGFLVPNPYEFFVIQMVGGIACIFSIVSMRKRSQLFITITLLTAAYLISFCGITLMVEGRFSSINLIDLAWLAGSASLTLFSYPFIYFIEKVFGFTSDVSLLELSDTNNPLLKELALRAPGTFQHSLQVANLAEAVIYRIGGNSLLTRTGALYHDIGKMALARYFIENQMTGVNPHDELGFDESARIIISHVKHGITLGRKKGLPEKVIDFIRTHHGNSRVQYFYKSFLRNYPHVEVDENAFRYPGPIPFSRETAVVMMADAVEATSRSLKNISSETIDAMVEDIINSQIQDNQFINSDITFKDITLTKRIFKKMLMNIYHIRVEYPK
jgi:putative nucleotidyltransferase with HDIG domain